MAGSQLLSMPPELRLLVFDVIFPCIFRDIGSEEADHDQADYYRLPHHLPTPDFSGYTLLVNTCKQLRDEAVAYFEARILPHTTLYVNSVDQLRDRLARLARLKLKYRNMRFSLRTQGALVSQGYWAQNAACLDSMFRYADGPADRCGTRHTFGDTNDSTTSKTGSIARSAE